MWRGFAVVLVAACWTGPEQPALETLSKPPLHAAPPSHRKLEIELEKTACFGACPAFTLRIAPSGGLEWVGMSNVAVLGRRLGRTLTGSQLDRIDRALDNAHFFELDESGHVPAKPACVRAGNTVSCSLSSSTVCTDTSHTIITVHRDRQQNRVDNAHCSDENPMLDALERVIDEAAVPRDWLGR